MAFKKIVFAQANWDKDINDNFDKVIIDSDWQHLTILAPATGSLVARIYNGVLFLAGAVNPNATGDVAVAVAPSIASANFPVTDMTGSGTLNVNMNKEANIVLRGVTTTNSNHQFSFDGNNIFVGTWAQLGGA